nr:LOW QUALITY PROTEIN: melanopsin-like [Dermatophagoides farinae]
MESSSSMTTASEIVEISESSLIYNHDNNQATEPQWRYSLIWTIVLCIAYSIVFIMGLIGNSAVLWVINMMRHNTPNSNQMMANNNNNVFNYFICNLALADLLVILFCLIPNLLGNILTTWILGRLVCKAVPFLQGVAVTASIYTLVAISIDRFYGIYYPFNNGFSPLVRRYVIVFIWLFSFSLSSPWLIFFDVYTVDNQVMCHENWPEEWISNFYFIFINFGLQYLLPVSVTIFFYLLLYVKISRRQLPLIISNGDGQTNAIMNGEHSSINKMNSRIVEKSRLKVLKMLITIVSVFVLSWLPLYVIFCFIKFTQIDENSFKGLIIIGLTPLAQWLGATNSCINPILYFFFNPKFRTYLRKTITKNCSRNENLNQFNMNYQHKNGTKFAINCNGKNSYHSRLATASNTLNQPPTPTTFELNNSSYKLQTSPNISNLLKLSPTLGITKKNNDDNKNNQNQNSKKLMKIQCCYHQKRWPFQTRLMIVNRYRIVSESIHNFDHQMINLDCGTVLTSPTAMNETTTYPTLRMTNSLPLTISNVGDGLSSSSSSSATSSSSSSALFNHSSSSSSSKPLSSAITTITKNVCTQQQSNNYGNIHKKFNIINKNDVNCNQKTKTFVTENVQTNNNILNNHNDDNGKKLTTVVGCNEFPLNHLKKFHCYHNNDNDNDDDDDDDHFQQNNYHNRIITLNNNCYHRPNNGKQATNSSINNNDDDDDDNSLLFHRYDQGYSKIISNCFIKISTTSLNLETSV